VTGTHTVPVTGRYEWGRLIVPVTYDRVERLEWTGPLHLVAIGRDETGREVSWPAQEVLPWHEHPEAVLAPDWGFACPGVSHPSELPRHPIRWYAGFVSSGGQTVPVRDPDRPVTSLFRALTRLLGLVVLAQAEGEA